MTFSDDLAAELPPPYEGEPASLRQDIVDELSDHLHCALQRELLASGGRKSPDDSSDTNTERTAWQSVLTRFGNPAAIAYRLWWDAMKERVMAQRFTIALASVATVACVVLSVLMWQALDRGQQAQAALLQQSEDLNTRMIEALTAIGRPTDGKPQLDGWTPLRIVLVSEEGDPAQGSVTLSGTPFAGGSAAAFVDRDADPDGTIDCGMLPYGTFQLRVFSAATGEMYEENFKLAPDQPGERKVVCPTSLPPAVEVSFSFDPPEPLKADQLGYLVQLYALPRTVGGGEWRPIEKPECILWVDSDGQVLGRVKGRTSATRRGTEMGYLQGLSLSDDGSLPAYTYLLQLVTPCVRNVDIEDASASDLVNEWVVSGEASNRGYDDLRITPGDDNGDRGRITISEKAWESSIRMFQHYPESRQAAIPDGWETVAISDDEYRTGGSEVMEGRKVDLFAWIALGDELIPRKLIESMTWLAADFHPGQEGMPFGYRGGGMGAANAGHQEYVFLVRPELKHVLEELIAKNLLQFSMQPASNPQEEPVLHEDVLEQLRQSAERSEEATPEIENK